MPHDTRDRLVDAGQRLFQRQGYAHTGIKQILREADAAYASLYHFFPDGKEQLAAEAIRTSGALYQHLVESVFDAAPDPITGIRLCFEVAAQTMEETGFSDACPIATVAMEVADTSEALRQASAEVFQSWLDTATAKLHVAGADAETARRLGTSMIMLLEGAFLLARVMRTAEPLLIAAQTAEDTARRELGMEP